MHPRDRTQVYRVVNAVLLCVVMVLAAWRGNIGEVLMALSAALGWDAYYRKKIVADLLLDVVTSPRYELAPGADGRVHVENVQFFDGRPTGGPRDE